MRSIVPLLPRLADDLGVSVATRDTTVGGLCRELGVTRQTPYCFVDPKGELRADDTKLLQHTGQRVS